MGLWRSFWDLIPGTRQFVQVIEVNADLDPAYDVCRSALSVVLGCATSHRDPTHRTLRAQCYSRGDPVMRGERHILRFDLTPLEAGTTRIKITSIGHLYAQGNPTVARQRQAAIAELAEHVRRRFVTGNE